MPKAGGDRGDPGLCPGLMAEKTMPFDRVVQRVTHSSKFGRKAMVKMVRRIRG